MALPQEKQGYLDDLSKKTTAELKELLNRQESLIKKKKFLATLPDKGEKVNKFRDLLMKLIADRQEKENEMQQKIVERLEVKTSKSQQDKESSTEKETVLKKPSRFAQERKERQIKEQKNMPTESETTANLSRDSECMVEVGPNDQTGFKTEDKVSINKDFSALRDKSEQFCGLEDSLQNMNIDDENISPEDTTAFSSYEIKTIKKFNENSTFVETKFKPNSTLKNRESVDQPPYTSSSLVESKVAPSTSTHIHTRTRDLALEGPVYKYNKTKLISLEDSVHLQTVQKKITEEMQAKHAAERLSERLNITMETYNPEGTDMSYRENVTEMDSDDDV